MTRNIILTRDVTRSLPPSELPAPLSILPVHRPTDQGYGALDNLCTSHGFAAGWVRKMFGCGGEALLLLSDGASAGAGWLVRAPFYVDEIRRTFDPGADGDYYFGDFVVPDFRGRNLQRLLIAQRLLASRQAGRGWAMAMTREDNPASLKSYSAEGFTPAAEIRSRQFGGWQVDRVRRVDCGLPSGSISREGLCLPLGVRLRRRK